MTFDKLLLTCLILVCSLTALQQTTCASTKGKSAAQKPFYVQAKEEVQRLASRAQSGAMGKRLNSLGKDAAWVAQYGTSVATDYLSPYVDLGQQSLRLFKKRSARHYRLAQDKLELLKEWARDYLASRASNPTDQQAQDPTQRVEDIFVQDLLAEDVVGSDVIEEPVVQAEGSEGHQEL